MFYTFRFNMALSMLGVNPAHLNPMFRMAGQLDGKLNRHTPQEAALVFLPHLGLRYCASADPSVVVRWLHKGKISLNSPGIREALGAVGWAPFWEDV